MRALLATGLCVVGLAGGGTAVPIEKTSPDYTEEALVAELEGTVLLTGFIGDDGYARELKVKRPLGLGLDEKAEEAVQHWLFEPGSRSEDIAVDFALPSKQSRWHLIHMDFDPPKGASRPTVLSAYYPRADGILGADAIAEGRLLGAMGRQGFAVLKFDVDESGVPVRIQVTRSSLDLWGDEAVEVVRHWRFKPGMKDHVAAAIPCTLELAWGAFDFSSTQISRIRDATDTPPKFAEPKPKLISSTPVEYSEEARKAGLEGAVLVSLIVGEDGQPREARVERGLGLGLDENALDAVDQWRFNPVLLNGQPQLIRTIIQIDFRLKPK
jgi:TonB family protein